MIDDIKSALRTVERIRVAADALSRNHFQNHSSVWLEMHLVVPRESGVWVEVGWTSSTCGIGPITQHTDAFEIPYHLLRDVGEDYDAKKAWMAELDAYGIKRRQS